MASELLSASRMGPAPSRLLGVAVFSSRGAIVARSPGLSESLSSDVAEPFPSFALAGRFLVHVPVRGGRDIAKVVVVVDAGTAPLDPFESLPAAMRRVAERLAATPDTYAEIAVSLGKSPNTVRTQAGQIYRRLGLRRRSQLALLFRGLSHTG